MKELEEQTHPEILRSNLSNTVLELMKLGIKVVSSNLPLKIWLLTSFVCRIWFRLIMLMLPLRKR